MVSTHTFVFTQINPANLPYISSNIQAAFTCRYCYEPPGSITFQKQSDTCIIPGCLRIRSEHITCNYHIHLPIGIKIFSNYAVY